MTDDEAITAVDRAAEIIGWRIEGYGVGESIAAVCRDMTNDVDNQFEAALLLCDAVAAIAARAVSVLAAALDETPEQFLNRTRFQLAALPEYVRLAENIDPNVVPLHRPSSELPDGPWQD